MEVLALVDRGQPAGWTELAPGFRQLAVPRSPAHAEAGEQLSARAHVAVTDIVAGTHIWSTPAYVEALREAGRHADAVLLADVETPATTVGPGSADAAATLVGPGFDPVGDPELLADLGIPGERLLALCAKEGMLPQDVTAEVCQVIGCGDEVEELREA